jgi:hypothetical protein
MKKYKIYVIDPSFPIKQIQLSQTAEGKDIRTDFVDYRSARIYALKELKKYKTPKHKNNYLYNCDDRHVNIEEDSEKISRLEQLVKENRKKGLYT